MHHYGYVIGDVNEGNILVSNHACVTLIDCDSVQVRTSGTVYYCEVGVAQFTPPEIQNSKDFRMERSKNHDNFGLAILIFQLLFMGRHPFAGVYSGQGGHADRTGDRGYRFAFGRDAPKKQMSPPPNSVGLDIVLQEVAGLFEQAFCQSRRKNRPSAGEWWTALDSLERELKRCSADSGHVYFSGLSRPAHGAGSSRSPGRSSSCARTRSPNSTWQPNGKKSPRSRRPVRSRPSPRTSPTPPRSSSHRIWNDRFSSRKSGWPLGWCS